MPKRVSKNWRKLQRLKAAVQKGLDDSEAGLYQPVPELASPDFMAGGREFHKEREVPTLTLRQIALHGGLTDAISTGGLSMQTAELRTLLLDHGSDAYKKLVQGAKIGPLFSAEQMGYKE